MNLHTQYLAFICKSEKNDEKAFNRKKWFGKFLLWIRLLYSSLQNTISISTLSISISLYETGLSFNYPYLPSPLNFSLLHFDLVLISQVHVYSETDLKVFLYAEDLFVYLSNLCSCYPEHFNHLVKWLAIN